MGIFSNFFKSQPLPEDEIEESENVMRKLRENRQENTSQWVASIQDPNSMLPPTYTRVKNPPLPTVEDVDQRDEGDGFVYQPPIEAMYENFEDGKAAAKAGLTMATATRPTQEQTNNSASDWVTRIFREFDRQGDTFNLNAQGTNMVLSVHPPQYTEEVVAGGVYGKDARVRFFKGYVSATFWGMMLHGHHDKIDVYIVPAEAILQMTLSDIAQSGFSPFITIDSQVKDGRLEWHVGGTTIVYDAIPNLARELLGDLVQVASGKLKTEELFKEPNLNVSGDVQNLSQVLRTVDDTEAASQSAPASAVKAAPKAAAGPYAGLTSLGAAEQLVEALSHDLATIARLSDPLTTGAYATMTDANAGDEMSDLGTAMRILLGQTSGYVAQFKSKKR